jgi:hypothetical protein
MTDPNHNDPNHSVNPYTDRPLEPLDASTVILRPTGVTVVGVLCIVGGGMGLLSGLMQLLQPLFQGIATAFVPTGQAGDPQREWFAEIEAVNAKYMILNLSFSVVAIAVSACLVIGGISLLKPTKWSGTWIRRTLLGAIAIANVQLILFFAVQAELQPVMARQFDVMAQGNQGANPVGTSDTFKTMQTVIMFAT